MQQSSEHTQPWPSEITITEQHWLNQIKTHVCAQRPYRGDWSVFHTIRKSKAANGKAGKVTSHLCIFTDRV